MGRRRDRNRERTQQNPGDPFANYDLKDSHDYAIGRERMADGTYRYFSGHVVAPDFVRDKRKQKTVEEAKAQGFEHGANEAHMAGQFTGFGRGYNQGGQAGFMLGNRDEYRSGYDEGDDYGYCGGYQMGAYDGDHGFGDYDGYGDMFEDHCGYCDYDYGGYPGGMGVYDGHGGFQDEFGGYGGFEYGEYDDFAGDLDQVENFGPFGEYAGYGG